MPPIRDIPRSFLYIIAQKIPYHGVTCSCLREGTEIEQSLLVLRRQSKMCLTKGRSDQALKLHCKTCEMTVSSYCSIVDNRNHASVKKLNLKKIADEVKQRKARILEGKCNLEVFEKRRKRKNPFSLK